MRRDPGRAAAHAAFERADIRNAQRGFGDLVAADPDDTPVPVMLGRTKELLASGATEGPPVTRLTTK